MSDLRTDFTTEIAGKPITFHIGSSQMFRMEVAPSQYVSGPCHRLLARVEVGPLYARILSGRFEVDGESVGIPARAEWSARDLEIVIFYGLVGGGMAEEDAAEFRRKHIAPLPLAKQWDLAVAILGARVEGV